VDLSFHVGSPGILKSGSEDAGVSANGCNDSFDNGGFGEHRDRVSVKQAGESNPNLEFGKSLS
jgi:hypothetical protein